MCKKHSVLSVRKASTCWCIFYEPYDILFDTLTQLIFQHSTFVFDIHVGDNKMEYVGCYEDSRNDRLLGSINEKLTSNNTPKACVNLCLTSGEIAYFR